MDVTYPIVKVYVTQLNDIIKCYSNVSAIWRTSATEVTALLKYLHLEIQGVQEKESIMGVRVRQKNSSLVITVWHHSASLMTPDSDRFFYLPPTPMRDPFNLGPVVQSVVSLTSSLRVISLTILVDSIYNILILFAGKMWVAFALQKLLTFFQQKISAYLHITRCKF